VGELSPHLTQCRLGQFLPPYQMVSSSIQPFRNNRYGPKIKSCAPLGGTESPSNTNVAWAEAYSCTKWHVDSSSRLATTDMGRKLGAVPFLGGGSWAPTNTMWPGPRPTTVPSFILIHPNVWPQYTNVTDRQADRRRQTTVG